LLHSFELFFPEHAIQPTTQQLLVQARGGAALAKHIDGNIATYELPANPALIAGIDNS